MCKEWLEWIYYFSNDLMVEDKSVGTSSNTMINCLDTWEECFTVKTFAALHIQNLINRLCYFSARTIKRIVQGYS